MSDNVDALLGGEDDVGEYDLRDEEEDALLEDDSYEQSRVINSVQEDGFKAVEESEDVLELSVEELLNEDEETDFNDSNIDDNPRDKFTNERAEAPSSSSSIVPDTTTQILKKPTLKQQVVGAIMGGPPRRNGRGPFRGGVRGRGQRGYQNVQNRNAKSRAEAWVKKPMHLQPWANGPPANYQQHQPQPLMHQPWGPSPQDVQYQQIQNTMQQHTQMNKPPVHQRLGYNQQHQQIQPFAHPPPAVQPPPMQMQSPQQNPFEQERIIISHPLHMTPQNYIPPQQYSQPPPVFNHPPPQYVNENMYHSAPSYQPPPSYVPPLQQQQQQFVPQYNPEPYMPQQPQQQVVFQNDAGFYEPLLADYNNGNDGYQQHYNQEYVTPAAYRGQHQQERIIRTNKHVNLTSPQKKRREFKPFVENKDGVQSKQRKVLGNTNLHEVQTVENVTTVSTPKYKAPAPIPDDEDEETKQYRLEIEQQKRLREKLLVRKEERRKLAARQKQVEEAIKIIPSPKELIAKTPGVVGPVFHSKPIKPPPTATNPNLRVINATVDALSAPDKDQLKSFLNNRKIIAKDDTLLETSIVVVSNLAAGTSEVKLRKICSGVGDIQNFELSPKERQATIQFNSVASAHAFYKRYQRFMLDLSMIQVTLKPYS